MDHPIQVGRLARTFEIDALLQGADLRIVERTARMEQADRPVGCMRADLATSIRIVRGAFPVPEQDPTIRAFDPGDLPVLQVIRRDAFEPVFRSFREIVGAEVAAIAFTDADAEQAKLLDDICKAGSGHHVLVVAVGEEIVGFVSFTVDAEKRTGELGLNAVRPGHSGRGLGTWMYEQALVRMKDAGAAVASVGTGGDPSHAPARRAYEKAGFGPAIPSLYMYRLL